jgi:predicted alpha/beta hydrolase family esterase
MFASDDDRYVNIEAAHRLAKVLGAGFHIVQGGGHLSVSAGYHTFPEVLDLIAPNA